MDRTVLLLLLNLQVFLLITAFTPADAAALVTADHQQQSLDVGITLDDKRKSKQRAKRPISCSSRPGGCAFFGRGWVSPESHNDLKFMATTPNPSQETQ